MTAFIVLGVSGAGKSTIGAAAAAQLKLPFVEADDFHPPANVSKMSQGIPLTESDRLPWIDRLVEAVNTHADADVVIACSALTKRIRDRLRHGIRQRAEFIYLAAPPEILLGRLAQRTGHFMKAGMLASQLETLQPPATAITVDTARPLATVIDEVVRIIRDTTGNEPRPRG
jgi:gluconokinase